MKTNGDYESKLWKILEREGLADLSQYHRDGFFDEVPFYSRFADVAFLRNLGKDKADGDLLRFALKFLKALIWYDIPTKPFFAAVTIWQNPADKLIVPNLFVCNGDVEEQIGDGLALCTVKSAPSKRIERLLTRLQPLDAFQVLEESETAPEMTRVFIGYSVSPYPNVVPVHAFQKRTVARRLRA